MTTPFGEQMTYLEALATVPDGHLLIWGGDTGTASVMHCVRDPRYAQLARYHAKGTDYVQVRPNDFTSGLLCACCLEPIKDHP